MKRKTDDRLQIQVRVAPELHARLHAAASERDLSVNFLVNRAIEDFLGRLIPASEWKLTRAPEPVDHPAVRGEDWRPRPAR